MNAYSEEMNRPEQVRASTKKLNTIFDAKRRKEDLNIPQLFPCTPYITGNIHIWAH